MEMITKQSKRMRRGLFAVAVFFGINATTCSAQEIYADGENITNADFMVSAQAAYGLHVIGSNNHIVQSGGILLTSEGAVGIRLDGSGNSLELTRGTMIRVRGADGKGVWIYGGEGNSLTLNGNIFATGNALELTGYGLTSAGVDRLTVAGTLSGDSQAIYIGPNVTVDDININGGAQVIGDIVSRSTNATNLNINKSLDYGGNIVGAFNVKAFNAVKFFGTATVNSVEVSKGAEIFGGTFTVDKFVNHGTIGSDSRNSDMVINGDLTGDGTLKRMSGGKGGRIIVNGTADVDGSTVTTDCPMPNKTETVLIADIVKGSIANDDAHPVPISAMLNATGKVVGNTVTVTTHEADNLGNLTSQEVETFNAMKNMYEQLPEPRQEEMRELYNLESPAAKETLSQIGSNDGAQIMSVAQQSTAVDRFIADRITRVFVPDHVTPDHVDVTVRPRKFADDDADDDAITVTVKVPKPAEENFWLNYMKNWGRLRGGTDYHGTAIVGGYDRPFGDKWRAGIFATYGTIGYSADASRATLYDTRLGLYAGYHNRASDVYFYINGGQLRNSLHRSLTSLGLSTNAKYKSHIIELGGEYKYDLQPRRLWHVSPYVNFQTSHLRQNSYQESGAGVYNQHVAGGSNTYFAAQVGLDLKRYYRTGMIGMRLGVKHGFTGVDPELRISYEGDGTSSYRLRQERDKTHFIFSLRGENEFARNWFIGGEAELQLGKNDHDVTASLMLRRMW